MAAGPIVAIGGGSMGSRGPVTTMAIDREAVRLTGKNRPNVLFVPTAGRDNQTKIAAFITHYTSLGCTVRALWLYAQTNVSPTLKRHGSLISDVAQGRLRVEDDPTSPFRLRGASSQRSDWKAIVELIDWADLIYVGGGNPIRMLKRWRALGVDQLLIQAHRDGKVLVGMSAGAISWFQFGLTDCWRIDHEARKALVCRGLGIIPGMCNPHYHTESWRIPRAREVLQRTPTPGVGVGIDDDAALIVEGDRFHVVKSVSTAWVFRSFWHNGEFIEERLSDYGSLALITKRG